MGYENLEKKVRKKMMMSLGNHLRLKARRVEREVQGCSCEQLYERHRHKICDVGDVGPWRDGDAIYRVEGASAESI